MRTYTSPLLYTCVLLSVPYSLVELLCAHHDVYSTRFLGLLTIFTNRECKLSILPWEQPRPMDRE